MICGQAPVLILEAIEEMAVRQLLFFAQQAFFKGVKGKFRRQHLVLFYALVIQADSSDEAELPVRADFVLKLF